MTPMFRPLLATLLLSTAPALFADTLARWDFTGQDGSQVDATTVDGSIPANLTVSPITRGDGFLPAKPTPFTENSFATRMTPGLISYEDAVEQNAYFEVTLTPINGKAVTIDRINLSSKRATKKSGPLFLVVRSSHDDYATDIAGPLDPLPVDLAEGGDLELGFGGALTKVTQPVTLRIFAYGRTEPQNPSGGLWVIGNSTAAGGLTIEGTVSP